jgi:hypothetical protein
MIHNRYLPQWAHRIANGLLGFFGCASAGAGGYVTFESSSFLEEASGWLLLLSPLAGVAFTLLNPRRVSLAQGLAGEAGYDELRERQQL